MTLALYDLDYATGMDRTRISTLIRERRKSLHLTLEACAHKAGMSKGNWGHIESETTSPPIETLDKMARALDAKWVVQLVAGGQALDADRQALVDAITTQVDQLKDYEVRALLHQIAFYEAQRELLAAEPTQTRSKARGSDSRAALRAAEHGALRRLPVCAICHFLSCSRIAALDTPPAVRIV